MVEMYKLVHGKYDKNTSHIAQLYKDSSQQFSVHPRKVTACLYLLSSIVMPTQSHTIVTRNTAMSLKLVIILLILFIHYVINYIIIINV